MNLEHLKAIRTFELSKVVNYIKGEPRSAIKLLEIGAGAGWQSVEFSRLGFHVEAIDLLESNYTEARAFDVKNYDGKHIPFPDNYFDIVFSSNVLEHVVDLIELQLEIQRVLKHDGAAIHIVPSGSWRFWSNLTHYPSVFVACIKLALGLIASNRRIPSHSKPPHTKITQTKENGFSELIKRYLRFFIKVLFPNRHGEKGNALTEIYYFSSIHWRSIFFTSNWKIEKQSTNELFYTGYSALGNLLPLSARHVLSHVIGSSCHIFVLKKNISQ